MTPLDDLKVYAALERLAVGLDVPRVVLGLPAGPPPPPPSRRERVARRVGQAGWWIGYTVSQLGSLFGRVDHALGVAGDRVIDGGDWLAGKVAGR